MQYDIKEGLKQAYNNHAQEREKNGAQEWKIRVRQAFLDMLNEEEKKTVLELGAGHGRDSKFFKDNNLEVIALDISEEMIRLCKKKGVEAYARDFCDLSGLNRKFDAVWAMNSLLHVEKSKLELVLGQIDSVLNNSGLFYMGVYGGVDQEGVWEDDIYTPHRFFSFYADASIKEIVKRHFEIVSFEVIETGGKYYFQSIIMRKKG